METVVPSERVLLQRARKFERQALAEIYDLFSPGLYRYAMRLLGDPQMAEECVAETFSRFLLAIKNKRGPRDYIQAYLYRMAHNWIVDLYRQNPPPDELAEEQPDERQSPESTAERNIQNERIRTAIHELTTDQQQVILLKFIEDLDNETVARILKKPVGAIKSLQHRALARLQHILNEDVI